MKKYLTQIASSRRLRCFSYGLLLPLAFAPFHLPGMAILSLGLLYLELNIALQHPKASSARHVLSYGLAYGLGFFGFGTSWIYVSIHDYGHLSSITSAFITFVFTLYLASFCAGMTLAYRYLRLPSFSLLSVIAFAALWTGAEYLRATVFTGFPWLLIGISQIDAPLQSLLPIIGIYGVTFLSAFAGGCAILIIQAPRQQRIPYSQRMGLLTLLLILLLLGPTLIDQNKAKNQEHTTKAMTNKLSVAVIQANLSMRDKWDEQLFWSLLKQYQTNIKKLLGTELILLPESAIPIPAPYIQDILKKLHNEAKAARSSILLGIPMPTSFNENQFYNALIALGEGKGSYFKQHLVPFGEYMPKPLTFITNLLQLPDANMSAGSSHQALITVKKIPIATVICYELAYSNLLRAQIPTAQLIITISDDGWFGHSLAMYQHQQIAQVQSLQTKRYQVIANNDGLSSVIDEQGKLVSSLAPFSAGILKAQVAPITELTPWVIWGDSPALLLIGLVIVGCFARRLQRSAQHSTARTETAVILSGEP